MESEELFDELAYKELDFHYKFAKRKENKDYSNIGKPRQTSPELELRGANLI